MCITENSRTKLQENAPMPDLFDTSHLPPLSYEGKRALVSNIKDWIEEEAKKIFETALEYEASSNPLWKDIVSYFNSAKNPQFSSTTVDNIGVEITKISQLDPKSYAISITIDKNNALKSLEENYKDIDFTPMKNIDLVFEYNSIHLYNAFIVHLDLDLNFLYNPETEAECDHYMIIAKTYKKWLESYLCHLQYFKGY